jgi:ATP-dependent exoDNAse (exonuclease V) beta subunit
VRPRHTATGLEFDTVILPGLARRSRGGDTPLLRWRRRDRGLLIAPSRPRGGAHDPIYGYLGELERAESDAELGRLLYVACTRARSRLHLVATTGVRIDRKTGEGSWKTPAGSSLARLWPGVETMAPPPGGAREREVAGIDAVPPLLRLPLGHVVAAPAEGIGAPHVPPHADSERPPFDWAAEAARQVGVLAHRLLARIGVDGPNAWTDARIDACAPRVRAELAAAGLSAAETADAASKVLAVARRTLADPRGRWLFDASHAEGRSEWALAGVDDGEIVHVVLDRTFVADGERWIVDFKTGVHQGADAAGFLEAEALRYREQLRRYARIAQALDGRPVRIALFHPLVDDGFRELARS